MVLAVDIAGAFDKVSHIGVTYKLQTLGVRDRALTWLTDYLSLRKLQAVVNGQSSSPYPIESGVPQESILGPTLFLIYVYHAEQCLAPGCSLATFADDTTVYTCIGSPELLPNSKKSLHATLDALHDWGKKWWIRFEPTKSQLMTIAHQRHRWPIMDLTFGDHTVSELSEVKLLGITFDSGLSFKTHLHNTALKANSRLGFLRKGFLTYSMVLVNEPSTEVL